MNGDEGRFENSRQDFRMAYGTLLDDIRFFKLQQWRVTAFVLLLLAALGGFFRLVDLGQGTVTLLEIWALIILAILLSGVGCLLLFDLQKKTRDRRTVLYEWIVPALSREFAEGKNRFIRGGEKGYASVRYESMLVVVMGIAMVVGASLVAWLLLKQTLVVAKGV